MSIFAGKLRFPFEPKMPVQMDEAGETKTPEVLRPTLGTLAALSYKPTRFAFNVRLSGAPTTGTATVRLYAGAGVVASASVGIVGVTEVGGVIDVDLSEVAGETKLAAALEVNAAADVGITATVDAVLDVDLPITQSGC